MLKTRLQNMKADPATGAMPYTGVVDCGAKVLRSEGLLAFWRGLSAYYARTAPHAMIVLVSMDALNKAYKQFLL